MPPMPAFFALFDVAVRETAHRAGLVHYHGARGRIGDPLVSRACQAGRRRQTRGIGGTGHLPSVTCPACLAAAPEFRARRADDAPGHRDNGPGAARTFGADPGRLDFDCGEHWQVTCAGYDPDDCERARAAGRIGSGGVYPARVLRDPGRGPRFLFRRNLLAGFRRGLEASARAAGRGDPAPNFGRMFGPDLEARTGAILAAAAYRDPGALRGAARMAAPYGVRLRDLVEIVADVLGPGAAPRAAASPAPSAD